MARHGRGRMGRYIKGNVNEVLNLGTLAALTLVGTDFDEVVNGRTLVSSIEATYALSDFTDSANDGPISVGIAHGDYTDAETQEVIDNTGSWNEGNKTSQEISKRLVRLIGTFDSFAATVGQVVLNDGKPIKTKLNWILNDGETLRLWAWNAGGSLLTTGADVSVEGHVNLFPR